MLRAARERTRAEITRQILDAARRHLATEGASGLSLRAIARELGASSSAVYRYVASRDELLTRLIVGRLRRLGAAVEAAGGCRGPRRPGRPLVGGLRRGAGLGPGQPQRVRPDLRHAGARLHRPARHHRTRRRRVSNVLLGILADAAAAEHPTSAMAGDDVPPGGRKALAPVRSIVPPNVSDALLQRGLMAWAALFGTVSFEVFGQLHGIVGDQPGDREAFFAESVRRWATQVGIVPGGSIPGACSPDTAGARSGSGDSHQCPGHRQQRQPAPRKT